MPIQVLDQNTINKIAAGEVIERPASVVKELVENAIDAKANAITIEIKDGGISFIRITDNGSGINKEELPMAFLRHSTSKIKSVEDLFTVSSLGFRGEALSSIAAVAQIELITKTSEAFIGARYVIEGGKELSFEEIGAPDGTTFIVRNLFYNTPVRRKFLKTATTEAGYVSALVEHLALSHPDISFRFINNNQNKLHTAGNGNLKDIIYYEFGRDISANLLEVKTQTQDISMEGFIGKPVISRGNRTYENYFINGRYIKSSVISKAIEEAYKGFIMLHQYPFTAIHFTIKPEIIDVNVHPTKMELRFSQNEFVYQFIYNSVRDALKRRELIPEVNLDTRSTAKAAAAPASQRTAVPPQAAPVTQAVSATSVPATSAQAATASAAGSELCRQRLPEPFEIKRSEQMNQIAEHAPEYQTGKAKFFDSPKVSSPEPRVSQPVPKTHPSEPETTHTVPKAQLPEPETSAALVEKAAPQHRIIGQLFDTYWLIEFEDKMYMMDQHAAHEKILFERTMKHLSEHTMDTQMIIPPMILSLNMREAEVLQQNMSIFEKLGYEIEEFGGSEYKVTGTPASLPTLNNQKLLIELIDELVDENLSKTPELLLEKVASMSCKAAVKGNHHLSFAEAKALMDELMQAENPYNCPHGRPTLISMSKYEIEKKFKRIV